MKTRVRDIFSYYHWKVRNNFLTYTSLLIFFLFLCCLPTSTYAGETSIFDLNIDWESILVLVLLLLVVSLLIIIAGLVFQLRRQKSKLRRNQEYLVRYITSNLELKKQIPIYCDCISIGDGFDRL